MSHPYKSPFAYRATILSLILWVTVWCATPSENLRDQAIKFSFKELLIRGAKFQHIAFKNTGRLDTTRLHLYLEGDGSPWLSKKIVSSDPTPRNPLMLKLMMLDGNPSLYLGRPCYIGLAQDQNCTPLLWTHQRYSADVVSTMAAGLNRYMHSNDFTEVVIFGHSGGGTLALLLAAHVHRTRGVVTLAGNLDIDLWATHHGYDPLDGSINPAKTPPLSHDIWEVHYVGRDDRNILPEFVEPRAKTRTNIRVQVIEGFDHTCCWQRIWPDILRHAVDLE